MSVAVSRGRPMLRLSDSGPGSQTLAFRLPFRLPVRLPVRVSAVRLMFCTEYGVSQSRDTSHRDCLRDCLEIHPGKGMGLGKMEVVAKFSQAKVWPQGK